MSTGPLFLLISAVSSGVGLQQEFTERLNHAVPTELVGSEEELPRGRDDSSVSHWLEI